MSVFSGESRWVLLAGLAMGVFGALLAFLGNPVNTGLCISCFLETSTGALGLHDNSRMVYMRPELLGIFLGSFAFAFVNREFKPSRGGMGISALGLGFMMILGSAVFLGCPIKALMRFAGGDMTSIAGIIGLVGGVWGGILAVGAGDSPLEGPRDSAPKNVALGSVAIAVALTALLFIPGAYLKAGGGGGSLHAPLVVSLAAGLVLGALSQRSRFCVTGSIRDVILTRMPSTGLGLFAAVASALALNFVLGRFNPGYSDQPGVHLEWLWSALGMFLTGYAAVFAGGCPFRQIVKAGEGDMDAGLVCFGMIGGAALVETWGLAGTPEGVPASAKAAVLLSLAALLAFSLKRRADG